MCHWHLQHGIEAGGDFQIARSGYAKVWNQAKSQIKVWHGWDLFAAIGVQPRSDPLFARSASEHEQLHNL